MKQLKHTPGDWKIDDKGSHYNIITEPSTIDDSSHIVCKVNDNFVKPMRQLSNARLIAAAPEMLEMLIQSIKYELIYYINMFPKIINTEKAIKHFRDTEPKAKKINLLEKATGEKIEDLL
jgi:hypothetical protein